MRTDQSAFKTVLAYGAGLVVLAALFGYLILAPDEVRLDPVTLCPRTEGEVSPRTTVVVLDRTDPITEVQQQDIVANLTEVFRNAAPRERFVIYPLDAREKIVLEGMVRCNPIGQKQSGVVSKLSTDKEFDAKSFKDKFLDPLVAHVAGILPTAPTTQTDSPIMELIQAVAVKDLKRSPTGRLILVSDLMQFSPRHSHYKGVVNFKSFVGSDAFKEVAVDLSNSEVRMLYIGRTRGPSSQPPGHREFWQQYFSTLRARPIVLVEVRGEAWNDGRKN